MNLFNFEISCFENFNKNNFKYICKYLNCYKSDNKIILVFEKFNTTLKNELINKKKLCMKEITCILIKINEMIKYFSIRQIHDIIFTPETIGINKKNGINYFSLLIFHLFPYHKLKQKNIPKLTNNSFIYLSPDFPVSNIDSKNAPKNMSKFNKKIPKIISSDIYLKAILWNLGALAYELFFYDTPFQPFPPNINKLKLLLEKGEYVINIKRYEKISKQFLSFLNSCLQRPQDIRPLTDELLFSEFITMNPENFSYLTYDNYNTEKFPSKSYLEKDGIITMNIDDNRMINATFDF